MNKKIIIGVVIIAIAAIICGGVLITNQTPEYKNVTVASATFEVPINDNGTVHVGEYKYGMGTSNYTSDNLFVLIVDTGIMTNVLTEDYVMSMNNGKDNIKQIDEKNGVKYYEFEDGAYKYLAITKIGSILVMVGGNDLDTIEHVFETIKFNTSSENTNITNTSENTQTTTSSSSSEDYDPKQDLPATAEEAGTYIESDDDSHSKVSYSLDEGEI